MAKRKSIPSVAAIDQAMERACKGKSRQLALAMQAMPLADLTKVLDRLMPKYGNNPHDAFLLHTIVVCVHARREGRADVTKDIRHLIKTDRLRRAQPMPEPA
jgi:hypothetical protein